MFRPRRRLASLACAAFLALPALSPLACSLPEDAVVSASDADRIGQLETARSRALAEALLSTDASERAVVSALFAPGAEVISSLPDGKYRCRTIKLGGLLPLTVYGYFGCTVSEGGTVIEKISGSQRFTGTLTTTDTGLFYQGAQHYNHDPVRAYGDDPEFDQVGCLLKVDGQTIYRLELPYPLQESTHDVIELVPAS